MAKNNRGKTLRTLVARGRGECPSCHRTGVKLLYEIKAGEQTFKVCKICKTVPAEKLGA
ncbi:MAG: hypothetical protein GX122_06555 [Candidatus Cloacimonetes bacterium]|nr:hypothetical protein [Candidatus Cloacimonadota bacterium]NLK50782.1 hypothetical protein [Candidatus Cloacimonadota bacterium]NLO12060.1 hypothetical protein [Candidatus Cloacimonadota bacterium]